jgi:hypothetical protein
MSGNAWQKPTVCPATVSIHYYSNVARQAGKIYLT